jgi:uncharacterized protein DUF4333
VTAQPLSPPAPSAHDLPTPSPAPRRRWGRVLGILVAVLVVLGGLAAGALLLFGTRTVEPGSVQREIVRVTETAVQVTPTDVRCPDGVAMQAGGTFTCTALVDSDAVTYWVEQDDDQGHLTITSDRLLRLDALERTVTDKLASDLDVAATVDCGPTGRTVVRNTPGQEIACTAKSTTDPTDGAALTVTVDADGAVTYRY